MGKIAAGFVVGAGLLQLPGLLGGAINKASDFSESLSKTRIVFGESSSAVEDFARRASNSLGMANGKALEATSTFGNFLQAMGLARAPAADMSMAMVTLAGDLASFNNANPEEVLLALRSGLSGEAEPMRRFGVALSETAVKSKAMQMGIKGVNGELTEAEKIQVRYALIMEQTSMAQGDFARTSDGLANKQRIQAARMEDLSVKFGQMILPIKLLVTEGIIKLIEKGSELSDRVMPKLSEGFNRVTKLVRDELIPLFQGKILPMLEQVGQGWAKIAEALRPLAEKLGDLLGDLFKHKEAWMAVAIAVGILLVALFPIPAAILGIIAVVGLLSTHWDEITAAVGRFRDKIMEIPVLGEIITVVAEIFTTKILAVIDIFKGIIAVGQSVIDFFKAVFRGDWEAAWTELKDIATGMLNIFLDFLKTTFITDITVIFQSIKPWEWVSAAFDLFKTSAQAGLQWVSDQAVSIITGIPGALGDLGGMLVQKGRDLIEGLWAGWQESWAKVHTFLWNFPSIITGLIGDVSGLLWDIGSAIINSLWGGMQNAWKQVSGWLGGLGGAIKGLKGPMATDEDLLYDEGQAIIGGLWRGMADAWAVDEDKIRAIGGQIAEAVAEGESQGLTDKQPQVLDTLKKLLGSTPEEAYQAAWKAGATVSGTFTNAIADGYKQSITYVSASLKYLVDMVKNNTLWVAQSNGWNVGMSFAQGVAQGIQSGTGSVIAAAVNMVLQAIAEARAAAQSASPSKEFMEIGRSFGEGTAIGIAQSTGGAVDAMKRMVEILIAYAGGNSMPNWSAPTLPEYTLPEGRTPRMVDRDEGRPGEDSKVIIDLRGAIFTGSPQENASAIERVIERYLGRKSELAARGIR